MQQVHIDATDFVAKSRAIQRLPPKIRRTAFGRALRHVGSKTKTAYIRRAAKRLSIAQKHIRSRTKSRPAMDAVEITVKSDWIPLIKLGASQHSKGVKVNMRGSYRHAFIAGMASGHTGVFLRDGAPRLPISELHGPNPAHDIVNNPDVYEDFLGDIVERDVAPRVVHEVLFLLSRLS